MIRIAVLVSGGGTNLQALLYSQARGGRIVLVVSDRRGAYALSRAEAAGIPTSVVPRRKGDATLFEEELQQLLRANDIDLIVLAGFLSLLSADFVRKYPSRILNIHPSLIPSFCGKGYYGLKIHQAALERGVTISGATVHYVNEVPDGGEIVAQQAVPVLPGDTPQSLQKRIMEEAEWVLLPRCTGEVCRRLEEEMEIEQLLGTNRYPGRGILMGLSPEGASVVAYFLMGRSNNSRNRVLALDGQSVRTEAFDASAMEDPSLIIYHPLRQVGSTLIVTNGDQSDTIASFLSEGKSFKEALETRLYEPDGPNYTPRISGIFEQADPPSYTLSILKREEGECRRYFFPYPKPRKGRGNLIHTYASDGNPLPSFEGEPKEVTIDQDIQTFSQRIWESLDEENRISLYVRYTDLAQGKIEERLINKHTR
ncbi:phosphoribosylglycinamide formyltransferase [Sphaerochaeta sp. PS]|uniref:phosphoribosylglycinamide formyltransferase n=1 Tax=Sphaerochaeta sp. PS TaxID=3076336 RepID=UPI0028A3631C|nr:phosphoribosylglycinamide formyltransferase [Sphaerochaeta sp. PS]MDT4761331.1 phosphoribosylglycinamide formyltransferase [Sphaerochaeta sp. PS]